MFEEVNHYLMAIAVISFVVCFVLRSYKNYLDVSIEPSWFTPGFKKLTKRGWTWLMTLSAFEALAISTTITAICWIVTMLYMGI